MLLLRSEFVRASSISKPRATSVEGSYSNRAASVAAEVSDPAELKYHPDDARVNVIAGVKRAGQEV
jgi:hypothetical protein